MKNLLPSLLLGAGLIGTCTAVWTAQDKAPNYCQPQTDPMNDRIIEALGQQGIRINGAEAQGVRANVLLALQEARLHGIGDSKVGFAAVEIAQDLGLDTSAGSSAVQKIVAAIGCLQGNAGIMPPRPYPVPTHPYPVPTPPPPMEWYSYFNETVNLWNQPGFMDLMARHQFHPVKISWEDIGRYENSCWGDRISDVGIWVRRDEKDASSARLALSVRRDSNFRDKVLMVPADRIKVHVKEGGRTVEKTLPQRLGELGLASQNRDRNVIVSNQFAIVPVPGRDMRGRGMPPRAAFNFSIFPYGSTNFVITDVIEGSSEAIVGPGSHQMIYANVRGKKAPFTASRAEDRQDLLRMERELKAIGMDVDIQRYYLIQIPLRRDARSIQLSNMGTPPQSYGEAGAVYNLASSAPVCKSAAAPLFEDKTEAECQRSAPAAGLEKVAIGHGETEGSYFTGSGYQGMRAEEPIRVTVVYFVTPKGRITERDMETFSQAFIQWDSQAIWGGSFVTKESN